MSAREHSIQNPQVRKAVLDLIEVADPGTDATMRSVRALLVNKAILDDPHMGVVYTGAAFGILLRVATESPDAREILAKYRAKVIEYERTHADGDQAD
jgi:hypothetical protein